MTKFSTRVPACVLLAGGVMVWVMLHLPSKETPDFPFIYVITPTYKRPTQKADLTRMGNTLRQVPNLHWIVVDDADFRSPLVAKLLLHLGIPHTHLSISRPDYCKSSCVARGSEQKNLGLDWLRQNRGPPNSGVVYFGDDDNTYDLELFEEMRSTKRVSVWPVGLIAARWYERPVVHNGKVVGWYTGFPGRNFSTDMAGFAVNLILILANPNARFVLQGAISGMQENDFLNKLTTLEDLEPKANNCTKVLVWHTRTEKAPLNKHVKDIETIEV